MDLFSTFRFVALGCLFAAAAAPGAHAADSNPLSWVPAGLPGSLQYWIDTDTVRAQGSIVHYRLHGRGIREESVATTVESEVGVDCARKLRVEYVATTRWNGGVRTNTGHTLAPVDLQRREATELAVACRLAGRSVGIADGSTVLPGDVREMSSDAQRGSGSGFAVSHNIVVTNQHVVRQCAHIRVVRDGVEHPAQVLAADAEADLAALVVNGPPLQALELAAGEVELGEPILVLGYPLASVLGPNLRVTAGIVSARTGVRGDPRSIQVSAPVQRGNSGGPVLDANGTVAGVVTRKLDSRLGAENVTFAVSARQVRQFLAAQQIEIPSIRPRAVSTGAGTAGIVRKAAPGVHLVQCG